MFACGQCVTTNLLDSSSLIDLSECLEHSNAGIINNWPPGVSPEYSSLLTKGIDKSI